MSFYKYLTIIFSIIMMNFAFAELKTFGTPTDSQEEESPTEEGVPEEVAPEDNMIKMIKGAPEDGKPEESAPEESMPEDGKPEESAPEEGDDMPTESDDSESSEDQPVKFKEEYVVSAGLGLPLYVGSNLDNRFDKGLGFNLGVTTPFSFNLMNKDVSLSLSMSMNSLPVNDQYNAQGTSDYSPTLLGLNMNTNISVLDMSIGSGLAFASGDASLVEDYSMTTLYLDFGLGYSLQFEKFSFIPEQFQGMNMSFNSNLVMIMGSPDDTGDTSNIINLGMSLGYPFLF